MLQNMLPLHITQIYVVQQQIIKNNIKNLQYYQKTKQLGIIQMKMNLYSENIKYCKEKKLNGEIKLNA